MLLVKIKERIWMPLVKIKERIWMPLVKIKEVRESRSFQEKLIEPTYMWKLRLKRSSEHLLQAIERQKWTSVVVQ